MALPLLPKWEIEFVAGSGTWVDVTADVDMGEGVSIQYGRYAVSSQPQPAALSLQLSNRTGKYTPKSQLLTDGTTNSNYPNVLPRRRIRGSYTFSGTTYYVYSGYVQSWSPQMDGGVRPFVPITAVDRTSLLAGVSVQSAPITGGLSDNPVFFIPFNDPSGSTYWHEVVSGNNAVPFPAPLSGGATYVSGVSDPVPFPDGLTGLQFSDPSDLTGAFWNASAQLGSAASTTWTMEVWATVARDNTSRWYPGFTMFLQSQTANTGVQLFDEPLLINTFAVAPTYHDTSNSFTLPSVTVQDSLPHHYVITGLDNGTNLTVSFYFDGVLQGSPSVGTSGHGDMGSGTTFISGGMGNSNGSTTNASATFGPTAFYDTALTSTQVARHFSYGTGGAGYTTGTRIQEYLRWAGATTNLAIATGFQTVAQHEVAGKDVLTICQDMAATEGGGAVFYAAPNGNLTFLDRHYRSTTTPLFTLDAQNDLNLTGYQPAFDDLTLVNQSTLSRPDGSDQSYTNAASLAAYGLSTDNGLTTLYPDSDQALLNLAQDRVASQANPAFRLGQVTLSCVTAVTTGLYQLLGVVQTGSRMRVANFAASKSAPWTQVDVYIEGWTINWTNVDYNVTFDTSPADNPPRGVVSTMKAAPVAGNMTLNTTLTGSGTTVLISNSDGMGVTTNAGSFPIDIVFGEEQIRLPSAGTGTNPQTFTGCTRGVNNTVAAPQTAGAVLSLAPKYGKVQL